MTSALQDPWLVTAPPGEDELPYSDGEPVDSEVHGKAQTLLTSSLLRALHDRDDVYVGGNMAVYFSQLQTKKNDFRGPEVFVVLDTVRRVRKSWVVWEENGRTPDVVIELISPTTEAVDRGEKMRVYEKLLRVSSYYLFDPLTGVFEGYQLDLTPRSYVQLTAGPHGDLPCPPLGLSLGVRRGLYEGVETDWLRWIDRDGHVLPTAEEAEREAARQLTDEAKQRQEAERRLAEALAELEKLKATRSGV